MYRRIGNSYFWVGFLMVLFKICVARYVPIQVVHDTQMCPGDVMCCINMVVNIAGLGSVMGKVEVSSWSEKEFYSFYGIPFGETTSGSKRFLPADRRMPWQKTWDATSHGRMCPNTKNLTLIVEDENSGGDPEDCLFLNVFTPYFQRPQSLLPVLFYIHGGAFWEGSSHEFPPYHLMEKDIILVVIQYRLGPFGFLSMDSDSIPGNIGLFDQLLALQWVHDHIGCFGGDNGRVTVMGQSAGALSANIMTVSPLVGPHLFQQVIMHSVPSGTGLLTTDDPRPYARYLATLITESKAENEKNVTINTDDDDGDDIIENVLRSANVTELLNAFSVAENFTLKQHIGGGCLPRVQRSGKIQFISETIYEAMNRGSKRLVPTTAGIVNNEGTFLLSSIYDILKNRSLINDAIYIRDSMINFALNITGNKNNFNESVVEYFKEKYFCGLTQNKTTFSDISLGLQEMLSYIVISSSVLKELDFSSSHGVLTYGYVFDYFGPHTRFGYGSDIKGYPFDGGVCHSDDLIYLFPWPYTGQLDEESKRVAQTMVDLWSSFVISGKPRTKSFFWPQFKSNQQGPYLRIGSKLKIASNFEDFITKSECDNNTLELNKAAIL